MPNNNYTTPAKNPVNTKQSDENKPKPSASTVMQVVPSVIPVDGKFDDFSNEQLEAKILELSKHPSENTKEVNQLAAELKERDSK